MNISLFTLSKRINSTQQPTSGTPGQTVSGFLNERSGVVSPSIKFQISNPSSYNYMYIPEFSRYYYIREWTYEAGFWWASGEVDPLASWKTHITSAEAYVLRSASTWDGTITDNEYPATTVLTNAVTTESFWPVSGGFLNGTFTVVKGSAFR